MSNIYHILYKKPALTAKKMPKELEAMAQSLVASGRMRIDAHERVGFVRYPVPEMKVTLMFSHRELHNETLLKRTRAILNMVLQQKHDKDERSVKVEEAIVYLRKLDEKFFPVDEELELKLARLIVQSAEPCVIELLLKEKIEVFISYDHTVGGMLDIVSWQEVGDSSGLQSNQGRDGAVFVACGGNPFGKVKKEDKHLTYGDGPPAMARLMVIAGQELGHYADMVRDKHGNKLDRFSTNLACTKAKPKIKRARLDDLKKLHDLADELDEMGLYYAMRLEKGTQFYRKHKSRRLGVLWHKIYSYFVTRWVLAAIRKKLGTDFVKGFKQHRYRALHLHMAIEDTKFNLAPQADAYRRPTPEEEEAVACVEALARVPQQVVKWGHEATTIMMPDLYRIYYDEVIPAAIKNSRIS